jgi:outer membrane protein assembly factor BamD
MGQKMNRSVAALVLVIFLAGCGLFSGETDITVGWSADRLYNEAKSELNDGNYNNAIKYYEKLEARFPYGRFAQQAQIEVAYAYYRSNELESAIAACDRFIKLHPNHPNVDYAYYLKGLVNFNEDQGILGHVSDQDMTERDPRAARDSFEAFKELVNRYPDSKYTPDSLARMKYLVNALAQHEVHVARYYIKRSAWVAAANRAQYALQNYPNAPAVEEALFIMVRAYDALGMTDLRDDADRVIHKNFPNSVWFKGGPKRDVPWWKLWD